MFGDPAGEILPELALDEAGQRSFLFLTARQKGLELFGDDLIKDSSFRLSGNIFELASTHAQPLRSVYSRTSAYSLQK